MNRTSQFTTSVERAKRGARSLKRMVSPHVCVVGSHVSKMRLAGHCSRSFVVTARRRKANSPTSVCLAVSGYAVLQLPDRECYPHSGEHSEREVASQYGLFYHRASLGPASLSIRLNRLPAVASTERNTESQKFGQHSFLSFDCLLTTKLALQICDDVLMRANDQALRRGAAAAERQPETTARPAAPRSLQ